MARTKGAKDRQQRKPRDGSSRFGAPAEPGQPPKPRTSGIRLAVRLWIIEQLVLGRSVRAIVADPDAGGVPYSTVQRWMDTDPDFRSRLHAANAGVTDAMHQRAVARGVPVIDAQLDIATGQTWVAGEGGQPGYWAPRTATPFDGPAVQAGKHIMAILGLDPASKSEVTLSGNIGVDLTKMPDDEVDAMIARHTERLLSEERAKAAREAAAAADAACEPPGSG